MLRRFLCRVLLAFGTGTAVAIGGWWPSVGDASEGGDGVVRPLVILADADPEIGATVLYDANLVRLQLDEKCMPAGSIAAPVALLESRDELAIGTIVETIETMEVGQNDTLFFFYSGRGGARDDGILYLQLRGKTQLTRVTLLSMLKTKTTRLTVVLTDCVSPSAVLPLPGENLLLREKEVLSRLLLDRSGFVDMNSFQASQVGHYFQQTTADGAKSRGSLFVREFFRECTAGKSTVDAAPSWRVFGDQLEKNMVDSLGLAFKLAGKSSPRPQTPQMVIGDQQLVQITNSIGMRLVLIPAGQFQMGSPESDSEAYSDQKPQHTVRITKPFYLGVTEVTQEQYERVMGTNPSNFKGVQLPVEKVSWEEAVEFCRKLSAKEGRTYRLPTEAEWEYACRAGSQTKWCFGDNGSMLGEYAWYDDNSANTTRPVGEKKPNAWGLYDMYGNVWEWCSDWYGAYQSTAVDDPTGAGAGLLRVDRGGGWGSDARGCRSADRHVGTPGDRSDYLGFRVASGSVDGTSQ